MKHPSVDTVALALAIVLGATIVLIMTAVIVALSQHETPPSLGENTTQVLSAAIAGVVGLLGAYLGSRHNNDMKR
jgi:multisubunit Na+/H+ antiporter MnhB subunit